MKYKIRIAVLLLAMVFLAPGGHPAQLAAASFDEPLSSAPDQAASVTAPGSPVVVQDDTSLNTHGWAASAAATSASTGELGSAVLAAYSLASASAPSGCHLPVSLLAAIGQVESGNLAGRTLDAQHRAVPAVLGPVLDGSPYAAIPDTDAGLLDGNTTWDRALGPLQLIPASWRLVGVDMDGDGRRDPQDIDDAAGAAMVYLCAGGRDLATPAGVDAAVLSYNHSSEYLRTVLAWKAVFDRSDLSGVTSLPMFDAMALPTISTTTLPGSTPSPSASTPATTGGGSSATTKPGATGTGTAKPSAGPSTAAASPSKGPSASPSESPSGSPSGSPSTTPEPSPSESANPDPSPDPTPDPSPEPTPFCSLVDPAQPAPSDVPLPEDLLEAGTAVRGAATTDDDGHACIPLVDPATGEPIVIGAGGTSSSQTRSADPGTP